MLAENKWGTDMVERVNVNVKDFIAEVALSRPDKMNALDLKMFAAISEAGEALKGRKDVRVVILYGQGENFCAGIDTAVFGDMIARINEVRAEMLAPGEGNVANIFQKPAHVWQELEMPVIAALNGAVFGGGAQIALGADFRFASADTKISIMESKWGLIPDMGITQNLPKLVRADQAKELMMTARILNSDEALSMGLISRICDDPMAEARRFAAELAARSPEAMQGVKRLVEDAWTATPARSLKLEATLQAEIIASENQIEAVMANVQKRAPKFK